MDRQKLQAVLVNRLIKKQDNKFMHNRFINKSPELTELLARLNSEDLPEFVEKVVDADQIGTFGNQPIHIFAYRGDVLAVKTLLDSGVDVNSVGDLGATALHEAAEQGHYDLVKMLVLRGASASQKNEFGQDAVDLAVLKGHSNIANFLTEHCH